MEEQTHPLDDDNKPFLTVKGIVNFIIAAVVMTGYYLLINWGLMEVQGLDFFYLGGFWPLVGF